jgi:hypothetical protein
MGVKRNAYRLESQRKRDHYEDQDVGGIRMDGMMWTGFVWLRIGTGRGLL